MGDLFPFRTLGIKVACVSFIKKNLNKIMKISIVSYLTFLPDWYIHKTKPGGNCPMYYGMTTVTMDPTPKTHCHHFLPGLIFHLWIEDSYRGERRTTICQSVWDKSEVLWEHVGEHIQNQGQFFENSSPPKFKRKKSKAPWVHAWTFPLAAWISLPKRVGHHFWPGVPLAKNTLPLGLLSQFLASTNSPS